MAASTPESYEQENKCSLCHLECISVPKLLACFHSFCNECLQEKMKDLNVGGSMVCPQCSMATTLPVNGVNGLPDNFLQETKQRLAKLHDGKVKFCNVCEFIGDEILAFFYCINCQYHLCERDKKGHKATPNQREHNIISYEEMHSGKYDPEILASTLGSCKEHSSELGARLLTFYCKQCETLVCHECILATHKDHKLSSVEGVSNDFQEKIAEMLLEVQRTREEKMETMKTAQQDVDDLNDNKNKLIIEIEKRGEHIISALKDLMQKNIENVQSKYSAEEEKCKTALKTLKDQSSCSENMKSFIERCLEYSSDVFIISHQKDISKNAEACLTTFKPNHQVTLKSYSFVANDDSLEETLHLLFGKVKDTSHDVQNDDVSMTIKVNMDTAHEILPPSVNAVRPFIVGDRMTKLGQWKVPGILDVTVLDTGDIIILKSTAIFKFVDESRFESILSAESGKMCDIQSYKNSIYISVRNRPRGFIACDIDGNVKSIAKVPEQELSGVCGIAVDNRNGTVYFGSDNGKVYRFELPYTQAQMFAKKLGTPSSLCCDHKGNLIFSEREKRNVSKYKYSGNSSWQYGSKGHSQGQFNSPRGVCTDEKGNVYAADHSNQRVHVLSPDGHFLYYVTCRNKEGMLSSPTGLHCREGKLYMASKNPDLLTVYTIIEY